MLELIVSPEAAVIVRSPLITIGYIFQLIVSLSIVIGLIFFSAKYILPKIQLPSHGKMIEIVDRIGLEPQVSVYVIRYMEDRYLLAVSNKNVTLIEKLESGS
jgi:flagellar biogenesis protein FliO